MSDRKQRKSRLPTVLLSRLSRHVSDRLSEPEPGAFTHGGHLVVVAEMAPHEEGRGRHHKVQHLPGENGHVGVLPAERVDVEDEALRHQGEAGPVGGEEHQPLLCQDAADDLRKGPSAQTLVRKTSGISSVMLTFNTFSRSAIALSTACSRMLFYYSSI